METHRLSLFHYPPPLCHAPFQVNISPYIFKYIYVIHVFKKLHCGLQLLGQFEILAFGSAEDIEKMVLAKLCALYHTH